MKKSEYLKRMSESYSVVVTRYVRDSVTGEIFEECAEFTRPAKPAIMTPYTVDGLLSYPDFIDSEILRNSSQNSLIPSSISDVMRLLGVFYVNHRNVSGFVQPSRGDGSCFYNAVAQFIELYHIDIRDLFDDAVRYLEDTLDLDETYEFHTAWYGIGKTSISMELRLIAAAYILRHKEKFVGTFAGDIVNFVYEHVIELYSLAGQQVIVALSNVLGKNIYVISPKSDPQYDVYHKVPGSDATIVVLHKGEAHYDLLITPRQMAFIAYGFYWKPAGDCEKIIAYFDQNKSPDSSLKYKYLF